MNIGNQGEQGEKTMQSAREEYIKISSIIDRYNELRVDIGFEPISKITLMMDIENADKCVPLNLDKLLEFKDSDFAHDMGGIITNMNRETGQLENCFVPRCKDHTAAYDKAFKQTAFDQVPSLSSEAKDLREASQELRNDGVKDTPNIGHER